MRERKGRQRGTERERNILSSWSIECFPQMCAMGKQDGRLQIYNLIIYKWWKIPNQRSNDCEGVEIFIIFLIEKSSSIGSYFLPDSTKPISSAVDSGNCIYPFIDA